MLFVNQSPILEVEFKDLLVLPETLKLCEQEQAISFLNLASFY